MYFFSIFGKQISFHNSLVTSVKTHIQTHTKIPLAHSLGPTYVNNGVNSLFYGHPFDL